MSFGLGQGAIVVLLAARACSQLLRDRPVERGVCTSPHLAQSRRQFRPMEVATACSGVLGDVPDLHVAGGRRRFDNGDRATGTDRQGFQDQKATAGRAWIGFVSCWRSLSRSAFNRVLNGFFQRAFFGWVSDQIGRERTMTIAFATSAGGAGTRSESILAANPLAFRDISPAWCFSFTGRNLQPALPSTGRYVGSSKYLAWPRTPACCTPPKALAPCWCLSPTRAGVNQRRGWEAVFIDFHVLINMPWPFALAVVRLEADARGPFLLHAKPLRR